MGTVSKLASATYLAHSSNYTKGRRGYKVCKFTPHHMAGVLTAKQCGAIFQKSGRDASSNYGIGNDGTIACYVEEENRAWTSCSSSNDCQAITVEVSNSSTGGQWPVSAAAWNSLVNLAVDVCKRYNFRLTFDGTPKGSLTYHQMFASTSCPGPYLKGKMNELAKTVNAILDGTNKPVVPVTPSSDKYKVGTTVTINGIYTSSNSTKKLSPARDSGKITKIISGAYNPYLLDDGNLGWTNEGCITGSKTDESKPTPVPTPSKSGRSVGDVVTINGVYTSSESTKKLSPAVTKGTITKIVSGAKNPYLLNNGNIGWVNDGCIVGGSNSSTSSKPASSEIKKGDRVKVLNNVDYNGTRLLSSVKGGIYDVIQVSGDRVVIGRGNSVTAAMKKSTLQKV